MLIARGISLVAVVMVVFHAAPAAVAQAQAGGKDTHDHRRFLCVDDGLKSNEVGCLLLAKKEIASFPQGPLFWHLNRFPTRETAEAAKGQTGMVVEAEGKFWLFTFGPKGAAPKQGELVASVGPLQLTSDKMPAAKSYEVVAYLAVMPPGMHTRVHTHAGPEAWYVLAGEQCLETPAGTIKARASEGAMVQPAIPMRLTNNGSSTRRALFIVIHDAGQPWTAFTEDWKPTGACDRVNHAGHITTLNESKEARQHRMIPIQPMSQDVEVLYGDPEKVGEPFVMRIRELAGGIIPPHKHPVDEHITVLKGTLYFGVGEKFDRAAMKELKAGGYAFIPKGSTMFGYTPEAAIVQVHGVGPFHIHWRAGNTWRDSLKTLDDPDSASVFKFKKREQVIAKRGRGRIRQGFDSGEFIGYEIERVDGSLFMALEGELRRGGSKR